MRLRKKQEPTPSIHAILESLLKRMSSAGKSNDDDATNHANVAFHPPAMLAAMLIAGFGLRFFKQIAFAPPTIALVSGGLLIALALSIFIWAVITMRRGGASVPTNTPTDAIVCRGPYRYSRNPIYLAMLVLLFGIGFATNSLWFVGFAFSAMALLTWGVITREEEYLQRKFSREYASYQAQVRRWL